jgi:hypothetical protein
MGEAKPTPGEWEAWTGAAKFGITGPAAAASMVAAASIKQSGFGHFVDLASSSQECPGIALGDTKERAIANANLFADAGNTYNTTGLTPSQLVDQREQLVERVKELESVLSDARNELYSLINTHNKQDEHDGSWLYDWQTVVEIDAALSKARPNTAEGE